MRDESLVMVMVGVGCQEVIYWRRACENDYYCVEGSCVVAVGSFRRQLSGQSTPDQIKRFEQRQPARSKHRIDVELERVIHFLSFQHRWSNHRSSS